jgi:hypothetical protein
VILHLLATSCRSEPPADSAVVSQFERDAQHYSQLMVMLADDRKVGTIGHDFLFEADTPYVDANVARLEVTDARLAEYKRLMTLCGTERLDRYGDSVVTFMNWGSGFAGHTHHKGVAWITRPPSDGGEKRFSRIRDNWYLFQD